MLTQRAIAKGLGISAQMLTAYKRRGMPLHSVEAAAAWKAANVRKRITDRPSKQITGDAPVPPPAPPTVSPYQDARTRWAIAEANERELSVLERKGVLVHRDKVRSEQARILVGLRQSLLQIPARLAPVLAAEADEAKVHDILQDELTAVLHQITDSVA